MFELIRSLKVKWFHHHVIHGPLYCSFVNSRVLNEFT